MNSCRVSSSILARASSRPSSVTTTLDQLAPVAEQHVLGAAQADALGAETLGRLGVGGGLGVGSTPQATAPVGVRCRRVSTAAAPAGCAGRLGCSRCARTTGLGRTSRGPGIHLPIVPSTETTVALGQADPAGRVAIRAPRVDQQSLDPGDACASQAAGDDGGVRGEPAT